MKRIVILLTALALVATGCNKGKKFTLAGDLETAGYNATTDSLLLQSDAFPTQISIQVHDGQFSHQGRIVKPSAATLKGIGGRIVNKRLVLEKGNITFQDGLPCGTPLNDAYSELNRSLQAIVKESDGEVEAISTAAFPVLKAFVSEHADDPAAVLAILTARRFAKPEQLAELIDLTSKEIQLEGDIHSLKRELKNAK